MEYRVYDMEKPVGSVSVSRDGLYLVYRAQLTECREEYPRLYYHNALTHRLGVFYQGICEGKRSARMLGEMNGEGFFSVCATPWRVRDDGLLALPSAIWDKGLCYAIKRQCPPQEALPYFCFFHPVEMEGEAYYLLYLDRDGRPIIPQLTAGHRCNALHSRSR